MKGKGITHFGGMNRSDRSHETRIPDHDRDPHTGRLTGIKHGPCRSCGHRKIISTATLLCGTQSCLRARRKRAIARLGKSVKA